MQGSGKTLVAGAGPLTEAVLVEEEPRSSTCPPATWCCCTLVLLPLLFAPLQVLSELCLVSSSHEGNRKDLQVTIPWLPPASSHAALTLCSTSCFPSLLCVIHMRFPPSPTFPPQAVMGWGERHDHKLSFPPLPPGLQGSTLPSPVLLGTRARHSDADSATSEAGVKSALISLNRSQAKQAPTSGVVQTSKGCRLCHVARKAPFASYQQTPKPAPAC